MRPQGLQSRPPTSQQKPFIGQLHQRGRILHSETTCRNLPGHDSGLSYRVQTVRSGKPTNRRGANSQTRHPPGGGSALNTLGDGRDYLAARAAMPRRDPPTGTTPRMADGKPDLSGYWRGASSDLRDARIRRFRAGVGPEAPSRRFQRCALRALPAERNRFDDHRTRCESSPESRTVVILSEGQPPRQIFLDGRNHPSDPNPTWLGHSVGRWDGDALVVDSVGFNDKPWLDGDGHPQTETMHLVEHYRSARSWAPGTQSNRGRTRRVERTLGGEANLQPRSEERRLEYVCNENERDASHVASK